MHVTRFSPGPDGESQFSEVEIALPHSRKDAFGYTIVSSKSFSSPHVALAVLPAELDQSWHPAPRRQLVTVLSGELEVGTPDGERRRFGPGNVFLADDVGTRGHTTRAVDGPVSLLFAPIPDNVDIWATPLS